jgi:radical SAM protein with 4Fe4S-binding SPASM domain
MTNRKVDVTSHFRPVYVVWELTLKCDLACRHCGSRAGRPREEEIKLAEAKLIADQLLQMGTKEVTFIGGEAYLHPDWLQIIQYTSELGIRTTMTTGARALTKDKCASLAKVGIQGVSVSLDGLEQVHDTLRAVRGSFTSAVTALDNIAQAGISPFANTQINRLNLMELEEIAELLIAKSITVWQVQLTGPMGRAADRPDWLLQPYEMLKLMPRLHKIALRMKENGCRMNAANNLGYYGPYEKDIRYEYWKGCGAGRYVLGIESNGDVKGCPSLPSTPYIGGNLRESTLSEIWHSKQVSFAREDRSKELWGHCKGCYYAKVCQGGCAWTSHTLLGRRGNMPYCHHRAEELAKKGKREKLLLAKKAPGLPFDFGQYELIEEDIPPSNAE